MKQRTVTVVHKQCGSQRWYCSEIKSDGDAVTLVCTAGFEVKILWHQIDELIVSEPK